MVADVSNVRINIWKTLGLLTVTDSMTCIILACHVTHTLVMLTEKHTIPAKRATLFNPENTLIFSFQSLSFAPKLQDRRLSPIQRLMRRYVKVFAMRQYHNLLSSLLWRRMQQDFLYLFNPSAGKNSRRQCLRRFRWSARVIAGFTDTICNNQFYVLEFCLTLWNFSC